MKRSIKLSLISAACVSLFAITTGTLTYAYTNLINPDRFQFQMVTPDNDNDLKFHATYMYDQDTKCEYMVINNSKGVTTIPLSCP